MYSDHTDIVYEISASSRSNYACSCHPASSAGARQWWSRKGDRHWIEFDTYVEEDRLPQGCRFYLQCRRSESEVPCVIQTRYLSGSRWKKMSEPVECSVTQFVQQVHTLTSCGAARARKLRIVLEMSYPCSVTLMQCEWLNAFGPRPRSYPPFQCLVDEATELVDRGIAVSHEKWCTSDLGSWCSLSAGMLLCVEPSAIQPTRLRVQISQGQEWVTVVDRECRPWGHRETRLLKFPAVHFTPRYYRFMLLNTKHRSEETTVCRWALLPPHIQYSTIDLCSVNMDMAQTTSPGQLDRVDNTDPYRWDGAEFEEVGVIMDCGVCCDEVVAVRLGLCHEAEGPIQLGALFEYSSNGCTWSKHELPLLHWSHTSERTLFVPPSSARYYRIALRTAATTIVQIRYAQLLRVGAPCKTASKPTITIDAKSLMDLTSKHRDAHSTPLAVMLLCLYSLCTNKDEYIHSVQTLLSKGIVYSNGNEACAMVDGFQKRKEEYKPSKSVYDRLEQYDKFMMQDVAKTSALQMEI